MLGKVIAGSAPPRVAVTWPLGRRPFRLAQALLLDLTILFAAGGQLVLSRHGEEAAGATLYAAGVLTLLASLALQRQSRSLMLPRESFPRAGSVEWRLTRPQAAVLAAAGLAQLVAALLVSRDSPLLLIATILWLLSLLLALGVALRVSWQGLSIAAVFFRARSELALPRGELIAVGVIVAVGAALRLVNLEAYPSGIHGDEGEFGLIAVSIVHGNGPNPFGTAFLGDPALFTWIEAPFVLMFGQTITALRVLAALAGTATLIACYALSRSLLGTRVAILATAFLAGAGVAVNFSRLALNLPELWLLEALCFYCVWRACCTDRPLWWLLSGMLAAGVLYMYFAGPVVGLALALFMGYLLATRQVPFRRWSRGVAVQSLGFALVLMPFAVHMLSHSDTFLPHIGSRMIFQSWASAAGSYGTNDPLRILWAQFTVNLSAFTNVADVGGFFSFANAPMLNGLTAALFILGLALMGARLRDPRFGMLFFWFWSALIVGGVLTYTSPQFQRLLPALLPAVIGAAVALDWIFVMWVRLLGKPATWPLGAVALLVPMLAAAYDAYAYFGADAQAYPWADVTYQARTIAALGTQDQILVAGAPFIYAEHGTTRYLAGDAGAKDVMNPAVQLPQPPLSRPLAVLVTPALDAWLPVLEAYYPDGQATPVKAGNGHLELTLFEVPSGGSSAGWPIGRGLAGRVTAGDGTASAWQGCSPVVAFRDISGMVPGGQLPFVGQWLGVLNVPSAGSYTLELWTDAAATLDMDGQALIQAPQADNPRSVKQTVDLTTGAHEVQIDGQWSHGPGMVEFYWQPPGRQRALVPADDLLPPT